MNSYFSVKPRYTPGSPALIPRELAERLAKEERSNYFDAISWSDHPKHGVALARGLSGIVEEYWEMNGHRHIRDVITGERRVLP